MNDSLPAFFASPTRFLGHYVRRRPWHFLGLTVFVVGGAACAVGVQYGIKLLVDAMASASGMVGAVWFALAFFITLIAIENVLWRLSGWLGCRTVVSTGVDIRLDLFEHLSGHPMRYFGGHLAGALGNRVTAAAGAVGAIISTSIWNIAPPCVDFIGAIIVFVTVDRAMAGALASFVVVVAVGLGYLGLAGRPRHREYAEYANAVGGALVDNIANVWIVKAFSARGRELARLGARFQDEARAQRRSWMYLEKIRVVHDLCLWLMTAAMLVWAVYLWSTGRITPGDVVLVTTLTFRILHGSRDLALALIGTSQQLGIIAEALKVIGEPHSIVDAPDAKRLIELGGSIEFERVWFGYPGGPLVLKDFSLRIPAGQRIGIVGTSGAGKSTVIHLIQRLEDVQSGCVVIDGQCVTTVHQDSLRAAISVVPQEVSLFHRSIGENIRYGDPDASDAEVRAAAEAACCDKFIRDLPDGYHTIVGERGVKLSGGQRQRIGIARALLKKAPILVLDEATASLDSETELAIQTALSAAVRNRTVVAVAHRLSTIMSFDRIVVIADGRIVEDGSPAELRRRSGIFQTMWRMQSEDS
jgi:ATP-binding cassette subfamily B protein